MNRSSVIMSNDIKWFVFHHLWYPIVTALLDYAFRSHFMHFEWYFVSFFFFFSSSINIIKWIARSLWRLIRYIDVWRTNLLKICVFQHSATDWLCWLMFNSKSANIRKAFRLFHIFFLKKISFFIWIWTAKENFDASCTAKRIEWMFGV